MPEKGLKMHKNCIQKPNYLDMSQMTSSFGVSQMPGFVASQKDYRKAKTRTRWTNKKQSEYPFSLFEVHITLGFKSEAFAFIVYVIEASIWWISTQTVWKNIVLF